MAISQNFLTGRMRKSAGGTRFSTWRGLNVVASKPMEVRQNVTPAVELNRSKMSVVGKFVSQMGSFAKVAYDLGIAKTTPFADTVKFFRTRMLDDLKLDVSLLKGASFGTGNVSVGNFSHLTTSVQNFEIEMYFDENVWGTSNIRVQYIVFNDKMTKVCVFNEDVTPTGTASLDLLSNGFSTGDKIYFGVKPVRFKPGADLSGKVKMCDSNTFITLT